MAILLVALPGAALAQATSYVEVGSSPTPVGAGVRALGMGEAFVAVADDASAASWNPAGMTEMERTECALVGAWTSRSDDVYSTTHPEAASEASSGRAGLNYLSVVRPFSWRGRNLAAGLNYQRMLDFGKEASFPYDLKSGPLSGRLSYAMRQTGDMTALVPAFACEVGDRLSLGLSASFWDAGLGGGSFRKVETSDGTVQFNLADLIPGAASQVISVQDRMTATEAYRATGGTGVNLGALWRVNHAWRVGGCLRSGVDLALSRTRTVDRSQVKTDGTALSASSSASSGVATLELPPALAIGASRRFSDAFLVSADATWTFWSRYRLEAGGAVVNPVTGQAGDSGDALSLRVGGEYLLLREHMIVPLRAGLGYDPEPSEGSPDRFYAVSFGSGVARERFTWDAAVQVRLGYGVGRGAWKGIQGQSDTTQVRLASGVVYWF